MSDTDRQSPSRGRAPERYGQIIVVGGGCYGRYYVRQLQRAAAAGAIEAQRILVVDHDSACAVASDAVAVDRDPWPIETTIVKEDWREFFDRYLSQSSDDRAGSEHDAIVPSPLMPHLMAEWLVTRARKRWPGRDVATLQLERPPDVPWERAGADGTHYVSFASWTCPINCIEPRICPHTRSLRSWSLPAAVASFAEMERERTGRHLRPVVLHCRHRAYGVGMFDTAEVVAGDDAIAACQTDADADGGAEFVIATVSHCHGALTRLRIPGAERGSSHSG